MPVELLRKRMQRSSKLFLAKWPCRAHRGEYSMSVNRRRFLENAALTLAAAKIVPRTWGLTSQNPASSAAVSNHQKAYGSGYFGEWIQDEFGLPAFHYTCDQVKDPKAVTEVNPGLLAATEPIHQLGNDLIVALAP